MRTVSCAGRHEGSDDLPLCFWPLSRLSAALQRRALSSSDAVQACRAQSDKHEGRLAAFISADWDGAARAAGKTRIRRGGVSGENLLEGVPFSLKDNIDVRGLPTTCHSASRKHALAIESSDVADRLNDAGAILVGKNALHELATGGPSLDLPWPPARNPWNPDLHPGGSSSGSGVAVASGMAYFSLGTDTGGSVRHPASACGVYGFKPSHDLVSLKGIVPLSRSCDHVGTLTRSASDIAFVMAALSTQPALSNAFERLAADTDRVGLRGRTFGVIDTFSTGLPDVDPAFCQALETLIAGLISAGAIVKQIKAPPLAQFTACAKSIVYGEAYAYHGREMDAAPSQYGERTRDRIGQGRGLLAHDYIHALTEQRRLAASLTEALCDVDVALSLSSFEFPCRIDDPLKIKASYDRQARVPFSLTGLPSASIPVGISDNGLPVGLSVSASMGHDADLVSVLIAIETAGLSGFCVPPLVR